MITSRQFFLPAVVETHGFIHHEFRRLVSILAAHVANKSAMDNDISAGERAILKGIYTARFYQRLSVSSRWWSALRRKVTRFWPTAQRRLRIGLQGRGSRYGRRRISGRTSERLTRRLRTSRQTLKSRSMQKQKNKTILILAKQNPMYKIRFKG